MYEFARPLLAALIVSANITPAVAADAWPSRPIRLVVAYPAGGGLHAAVCSYDNPVDATFQYPEQNSP